MRVVLNSARELAEALTGTDPRLRAAVLATIRRAPETALSYGSIENDGGTSSDLVDVLLELTETLRGSVERLDALGTLLCLGLPDPRILSLASREFLAARDPRVMLLAAGPLEHLPPKEKRTLLGPVVLQDANANRRCLAAKLLAEAGVELEPALALRVALLADAPYTPPALNEATLPAWLAELVGPYPRAAQKLLESQGRESLALCLKHWEQVPESARPWLLRLATQRHVPGAETVLRGILRGADGPEELLTAALGCMAVLEPRGEDAALLAPLRQDERPAVRAAAYAVGPALKSWEAVRATEAEPLVLEALARRWGEGTGERELELLAELLEHGSWRVRARATQALTRRGETALPFLRRIVRNGSEAARVAAAKALLELGQDPLECPDSQAT